MRTFSWLVVGAAAALLVNAGTAAAAPPDFWAAAQLCAAQGGDHFEPRGIAYRCIFELGELSEPEVRAARALCKSAYKGDFSFVPGSNYDCIT